LVALISGGIAVLVYVNHRAGLNSAQALGWTAVAVIATAFPLTVYWALGRLIRRLALVLVAWLLSLAPLYYYAYVVVFVVVVATQCAPGCLG
jgi:hypothetical protein